MPIKNALKIKDPPCSNNCHIHDAAGSIQKNAPTYSEGLWGVSRHTSGFTPTPVTFRLLCFGNSGTVKQGVAAHAACTHNRPWLESFLNKTRNKRKHCATVISQTGVPMFSLMGVSLSSSQMFDTPPPLLHFSVLFRLKKQLLLKFTSSFLNSSKSWQRGRVFGSADAPVRPQSACSMFTTTQLTYTLKNHWNAAGARDPVTLLPCNLMLLLN